MYTKKRKTYQTIFVTVLLLFSMILTGCQEMESVTDKDSVKKVVASIKEIPEYSGEPYVVINDNIPEFEKEDLTTESYEFYSELDDLGRCGVAEANIGQDLMPTEKRGNISQVKPSGWQSVKYDHVDGKYLYNRCHLIGYQLTAENANERNLITGTRAMNADEMLPFENLTADYIKETGNHVMYRVTPVFEGDNLVATGVQMEAESVEDDGEGVSYNVFIYNVQPGISIDYATGRSRETKGTQTDYYEEEESEDHTYILNTNTMKYHKPTCSGVQDMNPANRKKFSGNRKELEKRGYEPCGRCRP